MKNFFIEHRKGLFGTIVFHVIVAAIFIIFGFTTPLPLPEEEGILINFGTDDDGSGLIEPSAAAQQPEETYTVPESSSAEDAEVEEEILTQDIEEAPEVQAVPEKDPEAERKEQEAREAERLRQEELERQRQEELERQRLEEEQRRIDEIQNRTRNALEGARNAENASRSEGETTGTGNQGREDGAVDATSHTGGPGGSGDEGISFSLAGRTPQSLPKPEYNYQVEGIVVVEVTVDRNGNVTAANPGVKGSSTLNEHLMAAAKKAALAAKFDRKPDAPAFQKGTITYHFILQ